MLSEADKIRADAFSELHLQLPSILLDKYVLGVLVASGLGLALLGGLSGVTAAQYLLFLAAYAVTNAFSHPLGHLVAGSFGGISFNGIFLAGKIGVEPTLLVSIPTYLHAPPQARYRMHMGGPFATALGAAALASIVNLTAYAPVLKIASVAFVAAVAVVELTHSAKKGDVARAYKQLGRRV